MTDIEVLQVIGKAQNRKERFRTLYDVSIGHQRRQPDFIILHPQPGTLILEVTLASSRKRPI